MYPYSKLKQLCILCFRLTELISNYLCKQATSSSSGSGSKRKRNHGDRPGGDRGPSETSHGSSGVGGVGGSSSDQHPGGGGGGGGSKNGMLSHSAELTLGHLDQVCPLTQFFLLPFCENSLICLEGKSMTPHRGNTILFRSSQQLPRLRLGPSKGFLS